MLTFFRNRLFLAVTSGHFAVDVLNSTGPVLMAVLAKMLGLTYGQIGLALTLYTFAGSLSQPPFGWLADRFRGRPAMLAGLGVGWMALCLSIMAFQQSWALILPFFLLAPLGSGLFHPIGTSSAAEVNRARAGSATSVFFFCGQVGLALGPTIGGWLFNAAGSLGMLPLCALALLPAGLLLTAPAAPPAPAVASAPSRPAAVPGRPGQTTAPSVSGSNLSVDASDFPYTYYLRQLHAKVSERWRRPPLVATEQSSAVVYFEIDREGQIRGDPKIKQSSGNELYDQAALRAVVDAIPFPPLPREFPGQYLKVNFGFDPGLGKG